MTVTIDEQGRIVLPELIRDRFGLQPGDEISFEERDGRWVMIAQRSGTHFYWEGNVLVHAGVGGTDIDEPLQSLRDERKNMLSTGTSR